MPIHIGSIFPYSLLRTRKCLMFFRHVLQRRSSGEGCHCMGTTWESLSKYCSLFKALMPVIELSVRPVRI